MINTSGNAVDRSIFSLDQENKELDGVLTENFQDTTLPTTFESTKVEQGSDGKWKESKQTNEQPGKKSKQIRNDRLAKDEQDVQNYKDLASISDRDLLDKVTQINQKKNEIIILMENAISTGCTSVLTETPSSVGIGSTVHNDSATIQKYQFDDYSTSNPYVSSTVDLTISNSGDGYSTQYTVSAGSSVGLYTTIGYDATHWSNMGGSGNGETICAGYASSITNLIVEIENLQSLIDTNLITDTNTLKDKKSDSELFVWGQKRQETKLEAQKTSNENTKTLITDLTARTGYTPS